MNAKPRVGIGVIVKRDGKVLMGKRKRSHGTGTWSFAGGALEQGETFQECAEREVFEETGINVAVHDIVSVTNDIFKKERQHWITIFIEAEYVSGKLQNKEPHSCSGWKWFSWDRLPKALFLPVKNLLRTKYHPFSAKRKAAGA